MKQRSGGEGGGRKGSRGETGHVRRQPQAKGTKKHKKRVWVNFKDKSQGWKNFKKVQDVKARAALWKMRRREDREEPLGGGSGDVERTLTRPSEDPDAFLQQLLDPLHAVRKPKQTSSPDRGSASGERQEEQPRGENGTKRKGDKAARLRVESPRSRHSSDEEGVEESEEDAGTDESEEQREKSGEGARCRRKKRGLSRDQGEQRDFGHAEGKKRRFASESLESSEDEMASFASWSSPGPSLHRSLPHKHRVSLKGSLAAPAVEEEDEEAEGKEENREDVSAQPSRASANEKRNAKGRDRHGSSSAVFYPFKKAMEEAARRKAEQEERRRKAEEERDKREEERKIVEARRRKERKKLQARTKRGQPIMGNVMQVLLGKIRRREGVKS
ncbi:conserved hypothetical protein [Neospora caninum Liverpool]|uniref:rRNA processing protein n=1 Tax=Neospora caninum (strain Liverpool) TaxID=572307 RepID=F0VDS6_NEOCL|nr:conserved hypothetical protein [Neospora caninum Liverpool]CBZ51869.1 conserved hypothetical protein [Neospora caninum Liverpool]CEL65829.1 TPA: hypothetical protein BN1204_016610 [Neospora caninum Liverpool]|eukprot:XP_003881902.1 conserved hypothetical protein [Neospora caninum Liverpool]